jgi:hypothetical protein
MRPHASSVHNVKCRSSRRLCCSSRKRSSTWKCSRTSPRRRPEKRLPLSPNKTYRDGYRTAATFLNWAAQTYDARLIEKLQAQLEADTYTDDLFMEITGRPLDRLWTDFQAQ